eukprot:jgi/Ulvmu1/12749/UM095_0054.1
MSWMHRVCVLKHDVMDIQTQVAVEQHALERSSVQLPMWQKVVSGEAGSARGPPVLGVDGCTHEGSITRGRIQSYLTGISFSSTPLWFAGDSHGHTSAASIFCLHEQRMYAN